MTCIVGFIDKDNVYIGGDSAGVSGFNIRSRKDSKVFIKGEMIFGFTGSFRMGQILRYSFTIPEQKPEQDDFEYLSTNFIDAVISCFKEKGYASVKDGEVFFDSTFLLGYRGKLYRIECDFQVCETYDNYDACGCGEEYALGALKVMEKGTLPSKEKILKALSAAEYYSTGVSAPFNVINI